MRQVIAVGGIGFPATETGIDIYRYILRQSAKPRPRVCFVPTASAESLQRVVDFYGTFSALPCVPSWLSLFDLPTADLEGFLLSMDVILVGGGNTRSMLALWREWKLDTIFRKAHDNGVILSGSSAGANCWFEECTTDSIPGELTVLSCLGYLAGSFTPHYDVEANRRPSLHRLLQGGQIKPGYAADNDVAMHFVDGQLKSAVSSRESAHAYRVGMGAGEVIEEVVEVERIERDNPPHPAPP